MLKVKKRFLDALKGENDPEAKRKIIGRVFVEVFDEEALKLEDVRVGGGNHLSGRDRTAASATVKRTSSNLTTTWAVCRKR